jgi:hypothetical protein
MKPVLVVGALVVIGVAIVLWLVLNKDTSASTPSPARSPAVATGSAPSAPTTATPNPSLPTATVTPGGAKTTTPVVAEYMLDGNRVRDHRTGEHQPMDIPPNVHPPDGRKIKPTLTHKFSEQVHLALAACRHLVPTEAIGQDARMEGQIVIAIKDGKATVTKSVMQLRNVVGASVEPTRQCLEQKALAMSAPADDEADLDDYSINLSFAFR